MMIFQWPYLGLYQAAGAATAGQRAGSGARNRTAAAGDSCAAGA